MIELMICVVILGILANWAAPGLANLSARMTLDSEVERVWQLLRRARQEAASSGQPTWLCASLDGKQCSDKAGWGQTLLLFVDTNESETLDGDERIVTISQPAGNQVSITTNIASGLGYTPLGFTRGRQSGTFTLTNPALTSNGKKIIVHFARIRTEDINDKIIDPDDESESSSTNG